MLIKNKTDWLYNEFMIKPSLSLHINDRCFNECSCCIYDCKPTNKGKLDKELAMKCINEVPKGTTIVFHGGEPMLDFEYCRELQHYVHDNGYKLNIVTNGYWCNDNHLVDIVIEEFAPFTATISTDYWHQKNIPPNVIKNFIKRTKDNPDISIMFAVTYSNSHSVEEALKPYGKKQINSQHPIKIQKLGRAEKLPDSEFDYIQMNNQVCICSGLGISIDCDGTVRQVCQNENYSCVWGNQNTDNIYELYKKCHKPKFKQTGLFSWDIECCRYQKQNMIDDKWKDPNYIETIIK